MTDPILEYIFLVKTFNFMKSELFNNHTSRAQENIKTPNKGKTYKRLVVLSFTFSTNFNK